MLLYNPRQQKKASRSRSLSPVLARSRPAPTPVPAPAALASPFGDYNVLAATTIYLCLFSLDMAPNMSLCAWPGLDLPRIEPIYAFT